MKVLKALAVGIAMPLGTVAITIGLGGLFVDQMPLGYAAGCAIIGGGIYAAGLTGLARISDRIIPGSTG